MLTRIHTQNKMKEKKTNLNICIHRNVDIHIKKNCWIRGIHKNEFAAIHKSRIIRHRPFFFRVLPWKWASNAQLKPKNKSTWESQANVIKKKLRLKIQFCVFGAAFFPPITRSFYRTVFVCVAHLRSFAKVFFSRTTYIRKNTQNTFQTIRSAIWS